MSKLHQDFLHAVPAFITLVLYIVFFVRGSDYIWSSILVENKDNAMQGNETMQLVELIFEDALAKNFPIILQRKFFLIHGTAHSYHFQ